MREIMERLENYNGFLTTRIENIMCREKHIPKIRIRELYANQGLGPVETSEEITFDISAELLIYRQYEDDKQISLRIELYQNGRCHELFSMEAFIEAMTDDEWSQAWSRYEEILCSYRKKGFKGL